MSLNQRANRRDPRLTVRSVAPLFALLVIPSALAQDARVEELFPGVERSKRLPGADTPLFVATQNTIDARTGQFVALTYYQHYPGGSGLRQGSYALLKRTGGGYVVLLDTLADDGGSSLRYEVPFRYEVSGVELVVYAICYRGCRYSFYRLADPPSAIEIQAYNGLRDGESFVHRDPFRFDSAGLGRTRNVSRREEPICCPSGGSVHISYRLEGDSFMISEAVRTE